MQTKERLERIKSIIQDEKNHVDRELTFEQQTEFAKGYFEGKQQLCNYLLQMVNEDLREFD